MAALVFAPIDTTVALVVGAVVGVAIVALLVAGSPVVEVRDGMLRAGRAHIDVALLGEPVVLTGDQARHARGPGLDPRSWHLIRGGIDGVVVIAVTDPDDPDPGVGHLVADARPAGRGDPRAQATRRTPRR